MKRFKAWDVLIRHRARSTFIQVGQTLFPCPDRNTFQASLGNGKETIPGYYACFKKNMWKPMLQFKVIFRAIKFLLDLIFRHFQVVILEVVYMAKLLQLLQKLLNF